MLPLPQSLLLALSLSLLLATTACAPISQEPPTPFTLHPSTFILNFQTPTPGWTITPISAYQVGDEIWCIHQLTPPEGMVAQVISKIEGSITLLLPAPEPNSAPTIRHYILGKTWNWNSDPKLIFLKSLDGIADQLKTATPLKITTPEE
jgi:hypothetical protein